MARQKHGKEAFGWCDRCGVLILGEECSSCHYPPREFELSLPADVRPCMGTGIDLVKGLFERHFGTSEFLDGKLIFLNRIAGEDRTDEIVVEGLVLGIMRFDILSKDYRLDLKLDGARVLAPIATSNLIRLNRVGGHLKGRNLPGKDIREIVGGFEEGDPLVVLAGNMVCAGVARASSERMRSSDTALKIKDVGKGRIRLHRRDLMWSDFVRCNESHLRFLESKAVSDVRSFLGNSKGRESAVSFSGGKDSLACYGIARKAVDHVPLLFANTGLEFPETVEYVRDFAKNNDLELVEGTPTSTFWEQFPHFGPPAKDFRWCCKVCKLAPITGIIEDRYPNGVITLEGNRVYESFTRARTTFVERNPFVPGQVNLNPIREWRAAEVWGYIWMEDLEYNPLYDQDIQRIGCYLCPSCLASEWESTRRTHPDLYNEWNDVLLRWSRNLGIDDCFVEHGFWRWRNIPPKMTMLAESIGLVLPEARPGKLELRMVRGSIPRVAGDHSVEGTLSIPMERDFSSVVEALKALGSVRYSEEYQTALVRREGSTLMVCGGGQITSVASTSEEAEELFEQGARSMLRGQMCCECGICVESCPVGAIELRDGIRVDETRCIHCGACIQACVVAHYFDKLVA